MLEGIRLDISWWAGKKGDIATLSRNRRKKRNGENTTRKWQIISSCHGNGCAVERTSSSWGCWAADLLFSGLLSLIFRWKRNTFSWASSFQSASPVPLPLLSWHSPSSSISLFLSPFSPFYSHSRYFFSLLLVPNPAPFILPQATRDAFQIISISLKLKRVLMEFELKYNRIARSSSTSSVFCVIISYSFAVK